MQFFPRFLSVWVFLVLPFLFLRIVEAGGGGTADPGPGAPGAGNDGKTGAGAGNGGQPGAAAVDVQAAVRDALAAQQAEFLKQFKATTGHDSLAAFQESEAKRKGEEGKLLETRTAELAQALAELDRERTRAAILSAAGEAIDPATVLALLADKAKVDGAVVVIDGLPPADAVKKLLSEKPFLAKAGPAGSGAPQGGGGAEKNPWAKTSFNLTEQIRISKEDPALAQKLKAQAIAA